MGSEETLDPVRKEAFFENIRAFKRGEPMSPDRFPPFLYTYDKKQKKVPWRDLTVSGFWILSERYAEVFRDFDLGLGGLYPADIRLGDRKTPLEGNYYYLSAGSKKDALIVEKSSRLAKFRDPEGPALRPKFVRDDDLVMSCAALDGPDFWTDVSLGRAFFFSDRLVKAMKKAKIATKFRLYRCPIE